MDSPDARILAFRAAISCSPDQCMIHCGNRITAIAAQFLRHQRMPRYREIGPRYRGVRELEPSLGERVCELLRVLVEALRRSLRRPDPSPEVDHEHHRRVPLRGDILHPAPCLRWSRSWTSADAHAARNTGQFHSCPNSVSKYPLSHFIGLGSMRLQTTCDRVGAFC